jgi:hypothetical protein
MIRNTAEKTLIGAASSTHDKARKSTIFARRANADEWIKSDTPNPLITHRTLPPNFVGKFGHISAERAVTGITLRCAVHAFGSVPGPSGSYLGEEAWASRSAARLSKPMAGGCGRPGASLGAPSFGLRSPLTDPPPVIDVAYWRRAAPEVRNRTSALGESGHRIPAASVGQATEPCFRVSSARPLTTAHVNQPPPGPAFQLEDCLCAYP